MHSNCSQISLPTVYIQSGHAQKMGPKLVPLKLVNKNGSATWKNKNSFFQNGSRPPLARHSLGRDLCYYWCSAGSNLAGCSAV